MSNCTIRPVRPPRTRCQPVSVPREVTCQSKTVNGLISRGQSFYSGLMTLRVGSPSLSARALASLLANWRGTTSAPAYTALADRIRLLIVDGRIPLGTRIPAERDLAAQLELSRTTVTSAFGVLRDAGYLRSIRGSGSVARLPERAARRRGCRPRRLPGLHQGGGVGRTRDRDGGGGGRRGTSRLTSAGAASSPSGCPCCAPRSRNATACAACPPSRSRSW